MRFSELAERRVAVLGLGLEGRAFAERWLERLPGRPLTVLTNQPATAAVDPLTARGVAVVPGEVTVAGLTAFEVVVKSPGFSPYRDPVAGAAAAGVRFTSASAVWFAEHPAARTVCVTGTKGKSTTASLLAHLLAAAGRDVRLAGNIGVPLLELADEPPPELVVVELSSYQATDFAGHPTVGVVVNLYPEHLDWHGTVERYWADKLTVLGNVTDGAGVVNGGDSTLMARCPPVARRVLFNTAATLHGDGQRLLDGDRELLDLARCRLRGGHNLANIAAALTAARLLGHPPETLVDAVASFHPLAHRQQVLGEAAGLVWVNDSLATTPHATLAALAAFADRRLTVLVGGFDRGLAWDELVRGLAALPHVAAVVTMPANGPAIAAMVRAARLPLAVYEAADLAAAVALAQRVTPPGGVVLLSPGAPSYGFFTSYKERGEAFADLAGLPRP